MINLRSSVLISFECTQSLIHLRLLPGEELDGLLEHIEVQMHQFVEVEGQCERCVDILLQLEILLVLHWILLFRIHF